MMTMRLRRAAAVVLVMALILGHQAGALPQSVSEKVHGARGSLGRRVAVPLAEGRSVLEGAVWAAEALGAPPQGPLRDARGAPPQRASNGADAAADRHVHADGWDGGPIGSEGVAVSSVVSGVGRGAAADGVSGDVTPRAAIAPDHHEGALLDEAPGLGDDSDSLRAHAQHLQNGGGGGVGGAVAGVARSLGEAGAVWSQTSANAPWGPRAEHAVVALPDGRLVLLGGCAGYSAHTDELKHVGEPERQQKSEGVEVPTEKRDDQKEQPLAHFARESPLPSESRRLNQQQSPETVGLFAGCRAMNDVWVSHDAGSTWEQVSSPGAAGWQPRAGPSAFVALDGSIVLLGGADIGFGGGTWYADVWRSADGGTTWTQLSPNAPWGPRSHSALAQLSSGEWLLLGGASGWNSSRADVWATEDEGSSWSLRTAEASWTARHSHSALSFDGAVLIVGGANVEGSSFESWVSVDGGITWQSVGYYYYDSSIADPRMYYAGASVGIRGTSILLGGVKTQQPYETVSANYADITWLSTAAYGSWQQVPAVAPWGARAAAAAIVNANGDVLILGGRDADSTFADIWKLNGHVVNNRTRDPSATPCDPGTTPHWNGQLCTNCPRGTAAPTGLECVVCPATTAAMTSYGAASCKVCTFGSYAPAERSVQCTLCDSQAYCAGGIQYPCPSTLGLKALQNASGNLHNESGQCVRCVCLVPGQYNSTCTAPCIRAFGSTISAVTGVICGLSYYVWGLALLAYVMLVLPCKTDGCLALPGRCVHELLCHFGCCTWLFGVLLLSGLFMLCALIVGMATTFVLIIVVGISSCCARMSGAQAQKHENVKSSADRQALQLRAMRVARLLDNSGAANAAVPNPLSPSNGHGAEEAAMGSVSFDENHDGALKGKGKKKRGRVSIVAVLTGIVHAAGQAARFFTDALVIGASWHFLRGSAWDGILGSLRRAVSLIPAAITPVVWPIERVAGFAGEASARIGTVSDTVGTATCSPLNSALFTGLALSSMVLIVILATSDLMTMFACRVADASSGRSMLWGNITKLWGRFASWALGIALQVGLSVTAMSITSAWIGDPYGHASSRTPGSGDEDEPEKCGSTLMVLSRINFQLQLLALICGCVWIVSHTAVRARSFSTGKETWRIRRKLWEENDDSKHSLGKWARRFGNVLWNLLGGFGVAIFFNKHLPWFFGIDGPVTLSYDAANDDTLKWLWLYLRAGMGCWGRREVSEFRIVARGVHYSDGSIDEDTERVVLTSTVFNAYVWWQAIPGGAIVLKTAEYLNKSPILIAEDSDLRLASRSKGKAYMRWAANVAQLLCQYVLVLNPESVIAFVGGAVVASIAHGLAFVLDHCCDRSDN